MSSRATIALVCLSVLGGLGCNEESERTVTQISGLCVSETEVDGAAALEVTVQFNDCLSSSCDRVDDAECTIVEEGGVLVAMGSATITSKGDTCTADCGGVSATCTIVPESAEAPFTVQAGSAEVVYDGGSESCDAPL